MKAMLFAAGLGSRLKPLTDTMPKALVPVAGRPMLEHVLLKLKTSGFTEVVVNIHHFGEQIIDFLQSRQNFGMTIHLSDERGELLDTGGGMKKARAFFEGTGEPFLVHNVDILSDVNLQELYACHCRGGSVATLLVSGRTTSRYLLFDDCCRLCGWRNTVTGEVRPKGFHYDASFHREYAFSGIHVLSPSIFRWMDALGCEGRFSIMDFYLAICGQAEVTGYPVEHLQLMDIGKPETLPMAEEFLRHMADSLEDRFFLGQ